MNKNSYTPIIRVIVILIFLWIIKSIIQRLPMLNDLYLEDIGMSFVSLGNIVIYLIMIFVIWNFGREFAPELRKLLPGWPESASLLMAILFLISVVIAYNAFLPIAQRVLEDVWIFQIVFVLLALIPIIQGGLIIYRSVDKVTEVIGDQAARITDVTCPQCNTQNPASGKFCQKCGYELAAKPVKPSIQKCPKCGTENSLEAKFCLNCGHSFGSN